MFQSTNLVIKLIMVAKILHSSTKTKTRQSLQAKENAILLLFSRFAVDPGTSISWLYQKLLDYVKSSLGPVLNQISQSDQRVDLVNYTFLMMFHG